MLGGPIAGRRKARSMNERPQALQAAPLSISSRAIRSASDHLLEDRISRTL